MKPLVYIASPYTKGDPAINAHFQVRIFNEMMDDGIVIPFIPLASHYLHSVMPRKYEDWIEIDKVMVLKCEALVRLNAINEYLRYFEEESSGADGEVMLAIQHGIPVFYTVSELYDHFDPEL